MHADLMAFPIETNVWARLLQTKPKKQKNIKITRGERKDPKTLITGKNL